MTATEILAFGLRIRSAILIPGGMPIAADDVDITIVRGNLAGPRSIVDSAYARTDDGFSFTMPDVARYTCEGVHMTVETAPGADDERVSGMLIATVLPAMLWARGDVVLHAAAAVLPGTTRAVAVAGRSGSGKSTWLARMVACGATALADDSIRITAGADIIGSGLPAGRFTRMAGADVATRLFVPTPPGQQMSAAPLGAILILSPPGSPPERLHGTDAVQALLTQRHRPTIARLMRRDAVLLAKIATIAATVPIIRWPVSHDQPHPWL